MPSWDEVKASKDEVDAAHAALGSYLERPASQPQDIGLHKRLADELRLSIDRYHEKLMEFLRGPTSS
jgi:hypothetical protein